MTASSRCLGIVKEYEEVLVGAKNALPTIYFSEKCNQKTTCDFLTYVFEGILKWDKEDVKNRLNDCIIKKLKLERAINSLDFPPELDTKSDFWYVACILYPETFIYDRDAHTIAVYEKVLSGRLQRFPKWFFTDFDGEVNFALCLSHAINKYVPCATIKELYEFFSSQTAQSFLNDVKLLQPCLHYFESPLEMFHSSLCEDEKNNYYYYRYKLQEVLHKTGFSSHLVPVYTYVTRKKEYLAMKHDFEECFNRLFDQMEANRKAKKDAD